MAKRPIYYDTETTGVRSEKDRIIEIAAYDPVQDRTFLTFIDPEEPIPPEATAISKITDEMVKGAPTFKAITAELIAFCEGDIVLIAHNNDAFDKPFLENEFKRSGVQFPEWIFVDSLKWARKYRPDLPRHSLQHLREAYGIAANQAHRALDDVKVLEQIFSIMIDDLPIETVLELLQKPSNVSRMPFGKHQGKNLADVPRDYVQWLQRTGAFDKAENKELKSAFEKLNYLS
jgi:DNA polymerase-3 subunit epsilon